MIEDYSVVILPLTTTFLFDNLNIRGFIQEIRKIIDRHPAIDYYSIRLLHISSVGCLVVNIFHDILYAFKCAGFNIYDMLFKSRGDIICLVIRSKQFKLSVDKFIPIGRSTIIIVSHNKIAIQGLHTPKATWAAFWCKHIFSFKILIDFSRLILK